jgi:release factor glutamine methyltransferase
MKDILKNIVAHTYKPLLERYLSKIRTYNYENIQLEISPHVFHPGFFFSTRLLLNYIKRLPMKGKSLLEPGCGSGLISIYAARKGASVVSTDINPVAIEYLRKNSRHNEVSLKIIHSDLFQHIPEQEFDIIVINPPYYKKQPRTLKDYAWYCGENGEYFTTLFEKLNNYIHQQSEVYMVLFDGCDMEMINHIASQNQFVLHCVHTHKNLLEENSIFKIEKTK